MNEIMNRTFELLDELDKSDVILNLNYYKKKILEDEALVDLIQKGNCSDDKYLIMDIKRKLYQNSFYLGYMENYNYLMYMVMEINSRYKKILGNRGCYR